MVVTPNTFKDLNMKLLNDILNSMTQPILHVTHIGIQGSKEVIESQQMSVTS